MDFIKAAIWYTSAYFASRVVAYYFGLDQFFIGWLVSGLTLGLRYEGPNWIRHPEYRT